MTNILEFKPPFKKEEQPEEADLNISEIKEVDFSDPESLKKFMKIIEQRISQAKEKGNDDRVGELTKYLLALEKRLPKDGDGKKPWFKKFFNKGA